MGLGVVGACAVGLGVGVGEQARHCEDDGAGIDGAVVEGDEGIDIEDEDGEVCGDSRLGMASMGMSEVVEDFG